MKIRFSRYAPVAQWIEQRSRPGVVARHRRHPDQSGAAACRRKGRNRTKDRRPGRPLRTARLFSVPFRPVRLPPGQTPFHGLPGVRRKIRRENRQKVADRILTAFLLATVQTIGIARRAESGIGQSVAPRGLAYAERRFARHVDPRSGKPVNNGPKNSEKSFFLFSFVTNGAYKASYKT